MANYPKISELLKEHPNKVLTTLIKFAHETSNDEEDFNIYLEQFASITEPITVEIIDRNLQDIGAFEAYLVGGMEEVEKFYA